MNKEDKICVKWGISKYSDIAKIPLSDLGVESLKEWRELDDKTQEYLIQNALNKLPKQVSIVADSWG